MKSCASSHLIILIASLIATEVVCCLSASTRALKRISVSRHTLLRTLSRRLFPLNVFKSLEICMPFVCHHKPTNKIFCVFFLCSSKHREREIAFASHNLWVLSVKAARTLLSCIPFVSALCVFAVHARLCESFSLSFSLSSHLFRSVRCARRDFGIYLPACTTSIAVSLLLSSSYLSFVVNIVIIVGVLCVCLCLAY